MKSYQEVVISAIGGFGRGQLIISIGCMLPKLVTAWCMIMIGFSSTEPTWWKETTIFNKTTNTSATYRWKKDCSIASGDVVVFDGNFDTIVTEWLLICDKEWIPTTIQTIQMVGVLLGAAAFGQLGDTIGRRYCLLIAQILEMSAMLLQGFSVHWYMFATSSLILGLGVGGFLVVCNVYLLEFVGLKWRTIVVTFPLWGVGVLLYGGVIKILPNWRHICFLAFGLGTPIMLILCFTPTSPRWLFTHGKIEEGKKVLMKMSKQNKLPAPDFKGLTQIIENEKEEREKSKTYSYLSLIKFKSTRKKTLLLSFIWFCCGFCYYGLTLGVGTLSGDIGLNYVFMGIGEVLAFLMVMTAAKLFGRKYGSLVLFGVSCVLSFCITIAFFAASKKDFEKSMNWLALLSRFFLACAWSQVIIFTAELYPTVVRSAGYGSVSVVARIGGILAPQIKTLFNISKHLPFTINGVLIFISCILLLWLPDTYNAPMEDYIDEETPDRNTFKKTKLGEINDCCTASTENV